LSLDLKLENDECCDDDVTSGGRLFNVPQLVRAAEWPMLAACLQHVCMYFSVTSTLATDNASFTMLSITSSSTVHNSLGLSTVITN